MAQVTVSINGHSYTVACDTGQEERIRALARIIDGRVGNFAQQFAQAGESRLLVLAALTLADELAEAGEAARQAPPAPERTDDPALVAGIDRLAARIEEVAARLEASHI